MGASVQPDPVADYLAARQAPPASDPVADYLRAKATPAHDYHAEFRSGRLGKRMARENANDQEAASVAEPGYGERLATHVLNTGQGIPGVEAIEAGAGALGSQLTDHPMGYRESLHTLRDNTSQIGGKTAAAEKLVGSVATLPFLPASPAMGGALLGGATQALDADPETTIAGRVGRTAAGAAGGALLGKAGELAVTGVRGALATPAATKLMEMKAARAAKAGVTYAAALLQGKGRTNTPQIQAWLAKPDIAEIADELSQTRPFQGVARDDPRMLDGIYKVLSDRAQTVKKGLESVTPNRPNIGRFRGEDISRAQDELLNALDAPGTETITRETAQSPPLAVRDALDAFRAKSGEAARRAQGGAIPSTNPFSSKPVAETRAQQVAREMLERRGAETNVAPPISGSRTQVVETPPPMPGYRQAVDQYAEDSRNIDALRRGNDALRNRLSGVIPTGKNLDRTTPQALDKWAGGASLPERQSATAGVLGALKGQSKVVMGRVAGVPLIPKPSKALSVTPDLLRTLDPNQRTIDALIQAGLLVPNEMAAP